MSSHLQTGETQERRCLDDVAAAGGEVVQEEDGLAAVVDALQEGRGGITLLGRVDVDHGSVGDEREGGGQMEPAERDARHPVERRDVRTAHALEAAHLVVHEASGPPEGARLADEQAEVDVDGRMEGAAAQREVAKLHCPQVPQGLGEPRDCRRERVGACLPLP